MRKKTLDEIDDAIARGLYRRWMRAADIDRAAWERQYTVGISRANARVIAELTDGEVTADDWPHVLPELHLEPRLLHKRLPASKVNAMQDAQRIAISKGADAKNAFLKTIRNVRSTTAPNGYTQNALARALGISTTLLSRYRMAKGNPIHLPIPRARAERIQDLTGWPADEAHWPAGIT